MNPSVNNSGQRIIINQKKKKIYGFRKLKDIKKN